MAQFCFSASGRTSVLGWDWSLSLVGETCVVLQKVILEGREEEDGFYAPAGVANLGRERESWKVSRGLCR